MKLLIGVATYKRTAKLKRCLDSIFNSSHKDVVVDVVADYQDGPTFDYVSKEYLHKVQNIWVQQKQEFVIGAWNKVVYRNIQTPWDGFIGLCDDIELAPDALAKAAACHQAAFPDGDGVVGFAQDCPGRPDYTFKWFGQTLMGRKFVERYRQGNYKICCPDYGHFCQDEEMHTFATSLNKFVNCPEALIHHYHPSFLPEEKDETHDIVRSGPTSPHNPDFALQGERRIRGFLWGQNFNLLKGHV